jgi:hypothetical protein
LQLSELPQRLLHGVDATVWTAIDELAQRGLIEDFHRGEHLSESWKPSLEVPGYWRFVTMPAQDVGYWAMMATSQTRLSLWQAQVKDKFTRRNVIREDAEKGGGDGCTL